MNFIEVVLIGLVVNLDFFVFNCIGGNMICVGVSISIGNGDELIELDVMVGKYCIVVDGVDVS